jgi:hypothetical protein
MQRRHAVALCSVDIHALLQQRAHGVFVARHRGFRHGRFRRGDERGRQA